jgi:hypothetical protein
VRSWRDPCLWVQTDTVAGRALIKGQEAKQVAHLLSPIPPQWSPTGRGWVVPLPVVDDLREYVWYRMRDRVIVYERKDR